MTGKKLPIKTLTREGEWNGLVVTLDLGSKNQHNFAFIHNQSERLPSLNAINVGVGQSTDLIINSFADIQLEKPYSKC